MSAVEPAWSCAFTSAPASSSSRSASPWPCTAASWSASLVLAPASSSTRTCGRIRTEGSFLEGDT
eukprot:2838829-Pyramimonas_sp.AAC.2